LCAARRHSERSEESSLVAGTSSGTGKMLRFAQHDGRPAQPENRFARHGAVTVRLLHTGRTALTALADALLPQTCAGCRTWVSGDAGPLCVTCAAALTAAQVRPYCPRCGRAALAATIYEGRCGACRREDFWNIAGVARAGQYDLAVLRGLILGLKYAGSDRNAHVLADLLVVALTHQPWWPQIDALVPVPMHWFRRLQRPCDHADLLAETLARRTGKRLRRAVQRTRYTPSQTAVVSPTRRFLNIKGCFAPAPWYRLSRHVAGQTVCIIDNILVSGATICEVSKVLRRAGARRIYAAVLARAVLPGSASPGQPLQVASPENSCGSAALG
jgi:ComF family protein